MADEKLKMEEQRALQQMMNRTNWKFNGTDLISILPFSARVVESYEERIPEWARDEIGFRKETRPDMEGPENLLLKINLEKAIPLFEKYSIELDQDRVFIALANDAEAKGEMNLTSQDLKLLRGLKIAIDPDMTDSNFTHDEAMDMLAGMNWHRKGDDIVTALEGYNMQRAHDFVEHVEPGTRKSLELEAIPLAGADGECVGIKMNREKANECFAWRFARHKRGRPHLAIAENRDGIATERSRTTTQLKISTAQEDALDEISQMEWAGNGDEHIVSNPVRNINSARELIAHIDIEECNRIGLRLESLTLNGEPSAHFVMNGKLAMDFFDARFEHSGRPGGYKGLEIYGEQGAAVEKPLPELTYDQIHALRELMTTEWETGEHYQTTYDSFTWEKMNAYEKRLGWICERIGWCPQGKADAGDNDATPRFRLMTDTQKTRDFLTKHEALLFGPLTPSADAQTSPGIDDMPAERKKPLPLGLTGKDRALLRGYKISFNRRDKKRFSIVLSDEQKETLAEIGQRKWVQEGENELVSDRRILSQKDVNNLRGVLTPEILQVIDLHFELSEPVHLKPSYYHLRITDPKGAIKFFEKNGIPHNMPPIKHTQKIQFTSQDEKLLRSGGVSPDDYKGPSR